MVNQESFNQPYANFKFQLLDEASQLAVIYSLAIECHKTITYQLCPMKLSSVN